MNYVENEQTIYLIIFNLKIEDKIESYAVEIDKVHEIRAMENITPIPNNHNIVGIINLRGKIISIVDMKYVLGFGKTNINTKQRILIADIQGNTIGLLVDNVEHVAKIQLKEIEFNAKVLDDIKYVKGIIKLQDKLVLMLDLDKLFGGALR